MKVTTDVATLHNAAKLEEELNDCNQKIQHNSADARSWERKGVILRELGQFKESIEALEHAKDLNPHSGVFAELGEAFRRKGELEKARLSLEEALRLDNYNSWAWERKGNVLRELGKFDEAIEALEHARDLKPHSWVFTELGEAFRRKGELDKAQSNLEEALRLDNKNDWAWERLGVVLKEQNEYAKAIEALNTAISLKSENLWAHIELSEIFRLKGDFKKSLATINHVLDKDPNHSRALRRKGVLLRILGHYNEAEVFLTKSIEIDSTNHWSYSERGETLRAMGNLRKSLEDLNQSILLKSDNPNPWTLARMGAAYWLLNKCERALFFLDKSLSKDPLYAFAVKTKAMVMCDCGCYQDAFDLINDTLNNAKIKGEDIDAWFFISKGWSEENLKLRHDALKSYERARELVEKKLEQENEAYDLENRQKIPYMVCKLRALRGKADIFYESLLLGDVSFQCGDNISIYQEVAEDLEMYRPLLDVNALSELAWCQYRLGNAKDAILLNEECQFYHFSAESLFGMALATIAEGSSKVSRQRYELSIDFAREDCDTLRFQGLIKLNLRYLKLELYHRLPNENYDKIINLLLGALLETSEKLFMTKKYSSAICEYRNLIKSIDDIVAIKPLRDFNYHPLLRGALLYLENIASLDSQLDVEEVEAIKTLIKEKMNPD